MDLDALRRDKVDTEIYDNMSITFNDAGGTFVSENGKGISFGESIKWTLKPLVKKSVTVGIETLGNFWLTLILIALTISFFLAVFQGSLVSTWMLINSLQLIAHVPLLANRLPSNAHYFLLNFLGLVRFNFESLTSQIDTISGNVDEAKLLNADSGYAHLRSNGYHMSFFRNMLLLLSIACIIGLVWLISAILQSVRAKTQQEGQNGQQSKEASANNFMVRFLYEIFFELMICAFINVTNQEVAGMVWWIVSFAVIVVSIFSLLAIFSLFCFNGPYVKDTYA